MRAFEIRNPPAWKFAGHPNSLVQENKKRIKPHKKYMNITYANVLSILIVPTKQTDLLKSSFPMEPPRVSIQRRP